MGKVSPKEKDSKPRKQKRQTRISTNNKYLRPGALAQLRYTKTATTKACTDLGKKRVDLSDLKNVVNNDLVIPFSESQLMMSPERFKISMGSPLNLIRQKSSPKTPKTPRIEDCNYESRLEALPMDLMVKILCHLHHDQLRAVFHVSRKVRMAVILARQYHFNYITPGRSPQEILQSISPVATHRWPLFGKGESRRLRMPSPHTPKAPRHGPRPPSRLKHTETRPIAAALFQESSFPARCMVPSVLSKPLYKNRALVYEDELCQAVTQNKLL